MASGGERRPETDLLPIGRRRRLIPIDDFDKLVCTAAAAMSEQARRILFGQHELVSRATRLRSVSPVLVELTAFAYAEPKPARHHLIMMAPLQRTASD
jgi:hypothetical protein